MIDNHCKICKKSMTKMLASEDKTCYNFECLDCWKYEILFENNEIIHEFIAFNKTFSVYNRFKKCEINYDYNSLLIDNCYIDNIDKLQTYLMMI